LFVLRERAVTLKAILHKTSMGEMIHTAGLVIVQGSRIIRTVSSLWKIARRTP
jgi:hypothetical protein